ncbi:MAG TPA: ABC transporter permease [Candidatus Sulfopaludibacter sp.]|nr:ABC transporter permease [Candidatus Sulfopaludibacter sp.]
MFARLKSLFANSSARLDEELRHHQDLLAADYQRRGLSPQSARQAARRDMGGLAQIRESHREQRRLPLVDSLAQDLRYAFRQLRASPMFTAAAILTLALGIGVNTAIYQALDAVVFRALPVRDPQRLVEIQLLRDDKPQRFSYPLFREMAARQQAMDGMFAVSAFPLHDAVLRGRGPLKTVSGVLVTGDYFRVLGISARAGRVFTVEDDRLTAPIAVISDRFWSREFDRSPAAIGQTLQINKAVVTIAGVTPPGFFGETLGKYPDLWLPMSLQPQVMATDWLDAPYSSWLAVVGRLRPGVSSGQVQPALDALYQQLAGLNVRTSGQYQVQLASAVRGIDILQDKFAHPLWMLMGTAGLVLLIACCNLANLLLGRAAARSHEIGVRLALGAGRARLIRQLITESLLLSGLGCLLAGVFGWRAARLLLFLAPSGETWQLNLDFGWHTAAFAAAAGALATLVFGLAPALTATRVDGHSALQAARRRPTGPRVKQLAGRILVAAQISISLLLLSGAALLVRSFWNLRHQDFGFRSDRVLTVNLPLEFTKTMMERNRRIRQPLYDRLNLIPGVRAAALSAFGPMSPIQHTGPFSLPQRPAQDGDYSRLVHITPGYFEAMGIATVAGRAITAEDREDSPRVAVLSQTAARTLFGGADPVGQIVSGQRTFDASKTFRVVGVAHDVRFTPRDPYGFLVYLPMTQQPAPVTEAVLRTAGDPAALAAAVRAAMHEVDPELAIGEIRPLANIVSSNLAHEKAMAALSACFGILALALTCIGVYGVVSYAVKRRTREIGIRLAMGAGARAVTAMLMMDLAAAVAFSLALGGAAALALVPAIRTQLFGIPPRDYSTLLASAALLALIAAVAAYLPARRAARLDPMDALREE